MSRDIFSLLAAARPGTAVVSHDMMQYNDHFDAKLYQ
jgi:hypothetical protein